MTTFSWKKITMTILGLLAIVVQVWLGTMAAQQGSEAAVPILVGLVLTAIVTVAGIVTQGKIDLSKAAQEGGMLYNLAQEFLVPILKKVTEKGLKDIAEHKIDVPPATVAVENIAKEGQPPLSQ